MFIGFPLLVHCVQKRRDQMVFCNIFCKTREILTKFDMTFLNKFAIKSCRRFPSHLDNVSTLPCETWSAHRTRGTIELIEKETPECPISGVASKFARFESSWLQYVLNTAREVVQNMHHWSGQTETVTENGVGELRSCRHCGSHLAVASLPISILTCVKADGGHLSSVFDFCHYTVSVSDFYVADVIAIKLCRQCFWSFFLLDLVYYCGWQHCMCLYALVLYVSHLCCFMYLYLLITDHLSVVSVCL